MTSTQDEREKHIASLRSLSAWLIANDHDMKLPDDVIDPDLAADFLSSLPATDTAGEVRLMERFNAFLEIVKTFEPEKVALLEFGPEVKRLLERLAAPQAPAPGTATSVAEEWCAYMDEAVSKAPEPLRKLGEYLSRLLDEDQWKTAERLLNAAVITAPQAPATGGDAVEMVAKAITEAISWNAFNQFDPEHLRLISRAAIAALNLQPRDTGSKYERK